MARFKGVVQVDGYPGFERLPAGGDIQLAACWAHARRKFYEVHEATGSPVATEALRRIPELYASRASSMATAKLCDVEPFAYLKDVLERRLTAIR